MKYFCFFCFFPTTLFAAILTDCGEYSVNGIVRADKEGFALIVHEKTLSQTRIDVSPYLEARLGIYLDKPVTARLVIEKKFKGPRGTVESILAIDSRLPDALNPKDTGFTLIKKTGCK